MQRAGQVRGCRAFPAQGLHGQHRALAGGHGRILGDPGRPARLRSGSAFGELPVVGRGCARPGIGNGRRDHQVHAHTGDEQVAQRWQLSGHIGHQRVGLAEFEQRGACVQFLDDPGRFAVALVGDDARAGPYPVQQRRGVGLGVEAGGGPDSRRPWPANGSPTGRAAVSRQRRTPRSRRRRPRRPAAGPDRTRRASPPARPGWPRSVHCACVACGQLSTSGRGRGRAASRRPRHRPR